MGGLRPTVQAMLEVAGDIHLSLACATDFAEVLGIVADRDEPLLVVLVSQAVAAAWAEELTRHGVPARALGARDAPPKRPRVVLVGPEWLSHPDHRTWVEKTMKRVLTRGGRSPAEPLQGVPVVSIEVAGEGAGWVPEGARREGYGFSAARFSVYTIGSPQERQRLLAASDAATTRVLVGSGGVDAPPRIVGECLLCPHLPGSFAELSRWIAQADVDEVEILFGPDDLMRLQLMAMQRIVPSWPPQNDSQTLTEILSWLGGKRCRSVSYAAAFGEASEPCGDCSACHVAAVEVGWAGRETPRRATGSRGGARTQAVPADRVAPQLGPPQLGHTSAVEREFSEVTPLALVDEAGPVVLSSAEAMALEALRAWRSKRARAEDLPPYIVFGNATLIAIVRAWPRDRDSFLAIKGCGEKKWERFGADVLNVLNELAA